MNKERLREIFFDQKDVFNRKKYLIDRDIDLKKYLKSKQIIVISGVRRCGKSSLLYLIKKKMQLAEDEYCYFNFDDERIVPDISLLDDIYNLHIEVYGKEPVLFFDEIQNVDRWEKFVNRIYERGIKVFITGSNAKLLSSEISGSITGRNQVIELYPFSFREYLVFKGFNYRLDRMTSKSRALINKELNNYMEMGGFPLVLKEEDIEIINSYFQDILYRDIISRYRISQVNEIKEIGLYFSSNIGKIFSYSTLQKISGIKSTGSVKNYLSYYEQSFLFFYLKKFDFSVKKQIMNPKKVYSVDPAFPNRLGFRFSENKGRVLENIIYLELRRRGKDVYYYKGKNECDFLVKDGLKITEVIQVAYILDDNNDTREFKGLKEAMKKYNVKKGLLICNYFDEKYYTIDTAIDIVNTWKWLLS